ncbi:centrosomal protein of 290 kDa isoform X3 [Scyliorhinus canicula]|uniref:centrosomal protein of 290 kDa isoform X3 n=1 Tax=Scyliorhinus canicula TaxID=7830 RepID=UPI0018F7073B|nr:centrosomal protein of 290 kDa isoform X3 [Scyliorhinus canicula]
MAPNLDWDKLMKVDPDSLPSREKLADKLLYSISKVEGNELTAENPEKLVQLFRITQSLMKMKAQEVELALEEVEKAGEEQAKTENQLKAKVLKLENELEVAQVTAGGRDTRFLREELRQLENQLQFKDREVSEMEKELNKEKKMVEQVGIRIKEIENENNKLRREKKGLKRENDQLRQDVIDYQKQIDSQRETLLNRRGDDTNYRMQLSKKNKELAQYLDEIQNLSEANDKLEAQNKQLRENLEESVQEMEKMTDEYNKMKLIVQQTDSAMDEFKREKGQLLLQVQDLTNQLQIVTEEEDPVMLAVNAKIEEWKKVLSAKDKEIFEYREKLQELRTKLVIADFDTDKSSIIALQQVLQERDNEIKVLVGQIEQYTKEVNSNVQIIEDLKMQLEKESSFPALNQQSKITVLQQKVRDAEQTTFEAKRMAELAEKDAREKDKELGETLTHLRAYESGVYGLENAVAEIKECKNHIRIRDHQIEGMTREINKLEMKINDVLDENENFRERLGLEANKVIDLSEFRKTKYLKQQQFQAENQILLKEVERLEEERLVLKRQIRRMAQDKGMRAGSGGISAEDLGLEDQLNERINPSKESEWSSISNFELKNKDRRNFADAPQETEYYRDVVLMKMSSQISDILQRSVRSSRRESLRQEDTMTSQRESQFLNYQDATQYYVKKPSVNQLQTNPFEELESPVRSLTTTLVTLPEMPVNNAAGLLEKADVPTTGSVQSVQVNDSEEPAKSLTMDGDPLDDLLEQLRLELSSLKSQNRQIRRELLNKEGAYQTAEFELTKLNRQLMQNEYISRELEKKDKELEQTMTEIAQLKSDLKELRQENEQFESGMKDILQAIKNTQAETASNQGEENLKIESLERLVAAIDRKNSTDKRDKNVHFKAQVDQLTGRNEELRHELKESRKEAGIAGNQLAVATEKITNLESELSLLRQGCNVQFQTLALPEGMVPSSIDVINTLNEYLVQLLQEISNKEKEATKLQEGAEDHKRKFAVIRHQQGLLYKEYQSERESWQKDIQKIEEEKKKLNDLKEQDQVKIEEYNQLLETLQMDPDEIKKKLAGITSKFTVLRVNESSLTRRYTTLLEMEQHLRKENNKLKNEIIAMETAVGERIGYLQRFKDMASFKIAALQKALDESVPTSDLERANKQYNELSAKYRDLLQKDNLLVQKTTSLEHLEGENTVLHEQITALNKELEITKEKLHTLEQAWEQMDKLGGPNAMDKETKAITNSEIVSISKKITMLEMKELNERQRAEHALKMYEHVRNTLKQMEERNSELETKFSEVTKINLEAQKVEQNLRDELANSVSQAVSDADKSHITKLEKSESELKVEVSKLRDIADVAEMQVAALEARQQSREKEVEALRKQVLDYQAQSDERALIATLHQHIVALQVSEATAVRKLEAFASKLQKMEACNLRLMQRLDEKDQNLFYARLEGRNKAKHLRQTVQSLRRQFSGALPLAQQEKFSKTMVQLQNDKLNIMQDVKHSQEERRVAEDKALELQLKLKGLEELIGSLKDAKGAQKVIEWHKKIEDLRLQDLKMNRCINKQNEELKYLNSLITEQEHTINNLEDEMVQQNKLHEERQIAWDRRELELQHQLDMYGHQQTEVLSAAQKFEEATGSIPDPNKPLPEQLNVALQKIREHVYIILETQATCRILEEKLKEKEASLWKSEQNVLSRDQVINELRLRLPATAEREKLMVDLSTRTEDDTESRKALKVAHQTIANLQARLDQKEEVLQKYQRLLTRAHQDQEEIAKKHEEDVKVLHLKLDSYADASLNKFKQAAMELMKKPSLPVPTSKHLARLAELEQTVSEQDSSLSALVDKLKRANMELEKQKDITQLKMKEHDTEKANLEEKHATKVKKLHAEVDELRCTQLQMEKELQCLQTELEAQKQANTRAPTTTMKNLVDRLKGQLALKEKQQKALSKALLDLRAEMTSHAEQQIICQAAQKEGHLNVQQIVDKQTKELRARIEDLTDQLATTKDNMKACKSKEVTTAAEIENLNGELQKKQRVQNKLQTEKDELEKENEELKKKLKRLCSSMQTKTDTDDKQTTIDELQKKVKRLECELDKKVATEQMERKVLKEDKTSKEEIVRWEEGKKWQTRLEGVKNKLKEKEKELEAVTKQMTTLKELYAKADQERAFLQKKLKARGITADHVIGVRTMECDREMEDLRRKNTELQDQIASMRQQQALPRDSVVEDLTLKNRYLHEKLQALEKQLSKSTFPRPLRSMQTSDPCPHVESKGPAAIDGIPEIRTDQNVKMPIIKKCVKKSRLGLQKSNHVCDEQEYAPSNGSGKIAGLGNDKRFSDATMPSTLKSEDACTESQAEEPLTASTHDGGNMNGEQRSIEKKTELDQAAEKEKLEQGSDNDLGIDIKKTEVNDSPLDPTSGEERTSGTSEPGIATGEDPAEDQGVESEKHRIPETQLQTSGIGSDASSQKEQELQRENLNLAADNVELRFQLEQANKDLPRLKDQIANLQEMYQFLKKEKVELERKLGNVRGSGRSGKTVPELEKTIGLMKKVVERVQRENEELKKAPGVISREKQTCLEKENERLKSELEKLKMQIGGQLTLRYESKTKGVEKILSENERLRKELKKEGDCAEKLRIAKNNLEIMNEKLSVQLEETSKRLSFAESRGPQLEGADSKSWKSIVVTRMYESKIKEMEADITKKNQNLTDLRHLLSESTANEQKLAKQIGDLEEKIEVLKHFPEEAKTEPGLTRELQLLRLTNDRLEKEKAELLHQLQVCRKQTGAAAESSSSRNACDDVLDRKDKLIGELVELQTQLKVSDLEKQQLQEEIKSLKKELKNFDPSFFEELEDLKFNYNQEVKRNILLEEQLKKLAEQFGVQVTIPENVSIE